MHMFPLSCRTPCPNRCGGRRLCREVCDWTSKNLGQCCRWMGVRCEWSGVSPSKNRFRFFKADGSQVLPAWIWSRLPRHAVNSHLRRPRPQSSILWALGRVGLQAILDVPGIGAQVSHRSSGCHGSDPFCLPECCPGLCDCRRASLDVGWRVRDPVSASRAVNENHAVDSTRKCHDDCGGQNFLLSIS